MENIQKVVNGAKLAIPSHSEPLRWEKIGKLQIGKIGHSESFRTKMSHWPEIQFSGVTKIKFCKNNSSQK